ncbi:cyclic-di-AMP receptor [Marinococcus halophilus]|uniref:cyclic-di-AMP receptor n=1 Tax=Marinococcus halophilus TaxID=1371 RepID=UPI003612B4DC
MKLLLCIIDNFYTDQVEMEMKEKGYRMTEIASSGGFLKKGNTTFLFGVDEEEVPKLKTDLKDICLAYEKHRKNDLNIRIGLLHFFWMFQCFLFFNQPEQMRIADPFH